MGAVLSILAYLLSSFPQPVPTLPRIYTGSSHAPIRQRSGRAQESEETTLVDFIRSKVPSLASPFRPAWWLSSGHLQTVYCVKGDFSKVDTVVYDRVYLRLTDGGTLGLDFTHAPHIPQDAPIIVTLHGLTGGNPPLNAVPWHRNLIIDSSGSYESYVRGVLAPACKPVDQGGLGYRGVVINYRGCAGVPLTSPRLYSACATEDLKQALLYIRTRYPKSRLLGLGFSLGANIMTRYVAEEGTNSRLNSCCAIACPWDLVENAMRLNYGGLISKYVYSRALGDNLLKIAKLHSKTIRTWVGHPISTALDAVLGLNRPTLEEFDTEFTRIAGGYVKPHGPFPFDTAWDYYTWASSLHMLPDVRVPFLAISSTDDPVVQRVPTQAGGNGYVALSLTAGGGHLGWFESDGLWKTKRWINRPVLEWLRAVGEDLIYGGPTGPEIYEESGFLKEVGREHFGCKEVEGGGFVVGLDKKPGSLLQGL